MKRLLGTFVAAGLLVGLVAAPVGAAGGIARNQMTTIDYHFDIGGGHDFAFVFNPCDGSVSATGGTSYTTETVTASLSAGMVTMTSVYDQYIPGYTWTATFPLAGGVTTLTVLPPYATSYPGVVVSVTGTHVTSWANHGAYVSAMGGGSAAAHSCIGMPIVTP
jgi:hypothetical protein